MSYDPSLDYYARNPERLSVRIAAGAILLALIALVAWLGHLVNSEFRYEAGLRQSCRVACRPNTGAYNFDVKECVCDLTRLVK